jgi:hypothetical protein
MNCRGVVELVVAGVGLGSCLIGSSGFARVALVATAVTGVTGLVAGQADREPAVSLSELRTSSP